MLVFIGTVIGIGLIVAWLMGPTSTRLAGPTVVEDLEVVTSARSWDAARRAINEGLDLRLVYWAANSEAPTSRVITPFITREGIYLMAYCHLRRDERTFRLDRIQKLALVERQAQGKQIFKAWADSTDEDELYDPDDDIPPSRRHTALWHSFAPKPKAGAPLPTRPQVQLRNEFDEELDPELGEGRALRSDVLKDIRSAVRAKEDVVIEYLSPARDTPRNRTVSPVGLRMRLYLLAWCHETSTPCRFAVGRIKTVKKIPADPKVDGRRRWDDAFYHVAEKP